MRKYLSLRPFQSLLLAFVLGFSSYAYGYLYYQYAQNAQQPFISHQGLTTESKSTQQAEPKDDHPLLLPDVLFLQKLLQRGVGIIPTLNG